jgi:ketosteroid isomerase-like protein
MGDARTPADVFHALVEGVTGLIAGDRAQLDRLPLLYAEQTRVVHPLAPLGDAPLCTRAELRAHFADGPGRATGVERFAAVDRAVHQSTDPEVVIGEVTYAGTVNGRDVALPGVFVLRVRDGLIVESHDYLDHVGMARAFGFLDHLAAQLARTA